MQKIILSRTDNIGDVVLTLPMAGAIKKQIPDSQVFFIGKAYTKPIVESSIFIDKFFDRAEVLQEPDLLRSIGATAIVHVFPDKAIANLAKKLKIPHRIGTSHRVFHWLTCNHLPNIGRKNSHLHEAQLNLKLLASLKLKSDYELSEIADLYGMSRIAPLDVTLAKLIHSHKFNLILHPKSKGSAREWYLKNYDSLIKSLDTNTFECFITGTETEGEKIRQEMPMIFERAKDLTGQLSLSQLISFINACDGLVACSTGPLHIAAALGKKAIGLFPPIRPMHPARWQAIGKKAQTLCIEKYCEDCRKNIECACIQSISPLQVKQALLVKINE
ncbi:glycosyltransferase family 9 protein [Thermoflexibacter ruber]|uniref:ADP-heptose:LPS heptosyltransferase n=1 Tax=Thermoflexibacter ruber TaxID=1003 RepID=A0A1I2GXB6_9BACT|nr:glycosyltransferase family 9 protein [Thermoflexibacter ruber]SFF21246.1 ADP-heptose:LPS heptosyltransferase [Thermoflexibacter ruber]